MVCLNGSAIASRTFSEDRVCGWARWLHPISKNRGLTHDTGLNKQIQCRVQQSKAECPTLSNLCPKARQVTEVRCHQMLQSWLKLSTGWQCLKGSWPTVNALTSSGKPLLVSPHSVSCKPAVSHSVMVTLDMAEPRISRSLSPEGYLWGDVQGVQRFWASYAAYGYETPM